MFVHRGKMIGFAVAAAAALGTGAAQADLALDAMGGGWYVRGSWANFGYSLVVQSPVRVDALGIWDSLGDGLAESHEVGLWDSNGTLLAQSVVTGASPLTASADGVNGWRFEDIAPVELQPGTYKLGAFYRTTGDAFLVSDANNTVQLVPAPQVQYGESFVTTGGTEFFTEPNTPTSFDPAYFGPNAMITAVPEPASMVLLAMGGLLLARRNRN